LTTWTPVGVVTSAVLHSVNEVFSYAASPPHCTVVINVWLCFVWKVFQLIFVNVCEATVCHTILWVRDAVVVKFDFTVVWYVMLCSLADSVPTFRRNMLPPSSGYMLTHFRRQEYSYLPPPEPRVSLYVIISANQYRMVGIVTRLNDRGIAVRLWTEARDVCLLLSAQTGPWDSRSLLWNAYWELFALG
jgi:hypothetical protein